MSPGCAKNRTNPFRWPTLIRPSDIATLIFTHENPNRVKPMNSAWAIIGGAVWIRSCRPSESNNGPGSGRIAPSHRDLGFLGIIW